MNLGYFKRLLVDVVGLVCCLLNFWKDAMKGSLQLKKSPSGENLGVNLNKVHTCTFLPHFVDNLLDIST
jgi:hypothetical protein